MDQAKVKTYAEILEQLRSRHRWTQTAFLRLAALSLAAEEDASAVQRMEAVEAELKQRAGWTGPLTSGVRFVLAAMIARRGLEAGVVAAAVEATLESFDRAGMKRGGNQPYLAALLLVLRHGGEVPSSDVVARTAAILDRWKRDHRWLTGVDDYPMAVLHADRGADPETLGHRVETIYRSLESAGCSSGNQLQLASHLLAVGDLDGPGAAARFGRVVEAFERRGERVRASRYDEAALLALLPDPERAVDEALEVRDALQAAEGGSWFRRVFDGLSAEAGLTMAVALVLGRGPRVGDVTDRAALAMAQAAVEAQQAAAAAAVIASTTAATTAATT